MGPKTAVVTLAVLEGRGGEAWWDPMPYSVGQISTMLQISKPTMQAYASRIGADFVPITARLWPDLHVRFEKFQIRNLFERFGYERMLYLDADVVVSPKAPNVFEAVPPGVLAAVNEASEMNGTAKQWVTDLWNLVGGAPRFWKWNGVYFNTGVMVIDREHRDLFREKPAANMSRARGADQGILNLRFQQTTIPFVHLEDRFNYQPMSHPGILPSEICHEAAFAHFSRFGFASRIAMMKEAVDGWIHQA